MEYKKPSLTVDMFIMNKNQLSEEDIVDIVDIGNIGDIDDKNILNIEDIEFILIKRKNNPYKDHWALPGGFVDYGETTESAAIRESKEETSIDVDLIKLFNVYSEPDRDPRGHTVTVAYLAKGDLNQMKADDDAKEIEIFSFKDLDSIDLAFDHKDILNDIKNYLSS